MGPPQRFVVGFRGREELCAGSASSVLSLWGGPIRPSCLVGVFRRTALVPSDLDSCSSGCAEHCAARPRWVRSGYIDVRRTGRLTSPHCVRLD